MTTCDAFRRQISPYLDGELLGDDQAEFEAHVRTCGACRETLEQERGVVEAIQRAMPLHVAPPELRARVEQLANDRRRAPEVAPATRGWHSLAHPLVLAASLVACVLAGAALLREPDRSSEARVANDADRAARDTSRPAGAFAALAVDTHLRHERGQLPLEVRSEAPADVSRFFEGRVPFHLTLPDYPVGPGETKPYRLVGGRLVAFDGDYAAYVAYHMDERPISLLVTAAGRVRPEGGEAVVSGGLTFHIESVAGLKVITWTDKGLTYALASDLAVAGNRSCMVCHGSAEERRKLEGL
ncbi:MAG TPA: zf-HC2 domain-containing protein [Vicinamibacteria bacterium]